jgi:hypothetical protein
MSTNKQVTNSTQPSLLLDNGYDLTKCNVLIATPCYGNMMCNSYFTAVVQLLGVFSQLGVKYAIHTIGNESLIPRGRNYYVSLMLANTSFTHLFFIDSDIQFNPENVIRMLQFDKPITGGAYPKKSTNWSNIIETVKANPSITPEQLEAKSYEYVVNIITREEQVGKNIQITNGFLPVCYLGTGFMLIKREVLDTMAEKHPELKYRNDIQGYSHQVNDDKFYALFDCVIDPVSRRYLSEDYAFCQRALELGYDIWCDIMCNLSHTGVNHYRGAFLVTLMDNIVQEGSEQPTDSPHIAQSQPLLPRKEIAPF